MKMLNNTTFDAKIGLLMLALLAIAPVVLEAMDAGYLLGLITRLVILTIAAVSLNLILGFGGMVSLGHAAFLGIGAYAVSIPAHHGLENGFAQFGIAIGMGALFALLTGAISLRMKGVHFIMITMAFAQMMFFALISLEAYGADDGLLIWSPSDFGGIVDIGDDTQLYYVSFASLIVALYLVHRLVNSRFGMVVQGARSNERRMRAMGFETYRYQLFCYVIAGALCAYAGALHANYTDFITPNMMEWTRSGELIFMVVLGGVARLYGPLFGVAIFLILEEYLSDAIDTVKVGYGDYWHFVFGLLLVLVVLFVRGGISGLLLRGKAA